LKGKKPGTEQFPVPPITSREGRKKSSFRLCRGEKKKRRRRRHGRPKAGKKSTAQHVLLVGGGRKGEEKVFVAPTGFFLEKGGKREGPTFPAFVPQHREERKKKRTSFSFLTRAFLSIFVRKEGGGKGGGRDAVAKGGKRNATLLCAVARGEGGKRKIARVGEKKLAHMGGKEREERSFH